MTDREWAVIAPLLPAERGRGCRPALDNRPFLNGMLWIARTGEPWRELPARYGKWNSVYVRFRRWSKNGVWAGVVGRLAKLGFTDGGRRMLAGGYVRSPPARVAPPPARRRAAG